jgi:hypothetical protein
MADKFYISNTGDDNNDGLSPVNAWKTFENINKKTFTPGDQILLKRDHTFKGPLKLRAKGTADKPVDISAYGEGKEPVITGVDQLVDFKNYKQGYQSECHKIVKGLFINDTWCRIARYPSEGFFAIDDGDKTKLIDRELLLKPVDCTGADIRIRAVNWQYEIAKVATHNKDTLHFKDKMIYQCNKDYGYFLDNKLEFLTEPGEWYYDESKNTLCFIDFDSESIDKKNVEIVVNDYGIDLIDCQYVQISGIIFTKHHLAGINSASESDHIEISRCEFSNIHQDGINLGSGNKYFTIKNNKLHHIKGRGISFLDVEDSIVENNKINHIGLSPGYGFDGVNNGTGIAVLKTELLFTLTPEIIESLQTDLPDDVLFAIKQLEDMPFADEKFLISALEEILAGSRQKYIADIIAKVKLNLSGFEYDSARNIVKYNSIEDVGLHGIRLDGKSCLCEFNIVKNSLLYMNDGGAIYSWAQNYDYSLDSIIRHNIIINAPGNVIATPDFHRFAHGIYLDNKCINFSISNNIVTGTTWGILANDESRQHKITGNVCFDNEVGLAVSEYFMPGTLYGCHITDNILFCKERKHRALFFESRISPEFHPATLNKNYYGSSYYTYPIMRMTFQNGHRVWEEFDLQSWQEETNEDENSIYFAPADPEDRPRMSFMIINETHEIKVFKVDNSIRDHYDIYGNQLGNTISLDPFTAIIVLDD